LLFGCLWFQGRDFTIDRKKMKAVKVILNKDDTSGYLKLPRHGLEARNDALGFESIRATSFVTEGAWYYEVTLCTSGIMQIGWATKHSQFEAEVAFSLLFLSLFFLFLFLFLSCSN